jgi:hypothetical protein
MPKRTVVSNCERVTPCLDTEDPVAAASGAFAIQIGVLGSEQAKRLDREADLDDDL